MRIVKTYGPPGTGKTTYLVHRCKELAADPGCKRIAAVSFSRAAASELEERLKRAGVSTGRDGKVDASTVHALAYRSVILATGDAPEVVSMRKFARDSGIRLHEENETDLTPPATELGRYRLARRRGQPVRRTRIVRIYEEWKQDKGLIDFEDMLELAAELEPAQLPGYSAILVDEAQDLSLLQWKVIQKLVNHPECQLLEAVGDDDQAVYEWMGGEVRIFQELPISEPVRVLAKSYRLRKNIQRVALRVAGRIRARDQKPFEPRDDGGSVESVELHELPGAINGKRTMVLARTNWLADRLQEAFWDRCIPAVRTGRGRGARGTALAVPPAVRGAQLAFSGSTAPVSLHILKAVCEAMRIPYRARTKNTYAVPVSSLPEILRDAWAGEEYAQDRLRDGLWRQNIQWPGWAAELAAKFGSAPPGATVEVSTIHAAKGLEADDVVVVPEMPAKVRRAYMMHPDHEHRVWYVAVSRARERLVIVREGGYPLHEE